MRGGFGSNDSPTSGVHELGRPLLLAFAASWAAPDRATHDALRAELLGLGAPLLVSNGERSFYIPPLGAPECVALPDWLTPDAVQRLAQSARGGLAQSRLTLRLYDAGGHLRFRSTRTAGADVARVLLETLREARCNGVEVAPPVPALQRKDIA